MGERRRFSSYGDGEGIVRREKNRPACPENAYAPLRLIGRAARDRGPKPRSLPPVHRQFTTSVTPPGSTTAGVGAPKYRLPPAMTLSRRSFRVRKLCDKRATVLYASVAKCLHLCPWPTTLNETGRTLTRTKASKIIGKNTIVPG